ncbi:MAG: 7-carboxy-7-deazaguanine synthase QueE [bacterium]
MAQKELLDSGKLLPAMEEFFSLQGEGFHTGSAAWFIRVGGCDVGCEWCDVKESWNAELFPPVETDQMVYRARKCSANAVIITGGEPLRYNLDYLCQQLKFSHETPVMSHQASGNSHEVPATSSQQPATSIKTFLETSGTQPLSGIWDWICLSPKREWPPREEFYAISQELKVIIHEPEDLAWAEQQASQVSPDCHLFLQPEWSRRDEMLPLIIQYIKAHPGWKLSLQSHKYIGIP